MSLINYQGDSKLLKRICALLKVTDVQENGVSIVDENGIAHVTGGGGGSSTLAGLSDVDTTGVSSGDVLSYNGTSQKWEDKTLSIPTKVSDLTNDSGFIDNTVNNLTNYYKKTETYTQAEVDALIGAIVTLDIEVVQALPTTDISTNTIYLVPKTTAGTDNVYDEYINTTGTSAGWELIGDTTVDLSNYYTKTQTDNLLSAKVSDNPTFSEASTRANIASGESFATILGKIKKYFTDLATVAFSGSYSDLSNKPTIPTVPTNVSAFTNDSGYITSAGSCAASTKTSMLDGFASGGAGNIAWGNQTGTGIWWNGEAEGGAFGFRKNNPGAGQLSMVIDGTVYVNEGANEVIHSGNIGSQSVNYAGSAGITDQVEMSGTKGSGTGGGIISGWQGYGSVQGSTEEWQSVLIMNHGNGATYYHQMLRFPFGNDNVQFQRMVNGTLQGWRTLIHDGNIGSQSVNYANSAGTLSMSQTTRNFSNFKCSSNYHVLFQKTGHVVRISTIIFNPNYDIAANEGLAPIPDDYAPTDSYCYFVSTNNIVIEAGADKLLRVANISATIPQNWYYPVNMTYMI